MKWRIDANLIDGDPELSISLIALPRPDKIPDESMVWDTLPWGFGDQLRVQLNPLFNLTNPLNPKLRVTKRRNRLLLNKNRRINAVNDLADQASKFIRIAVFIVRNNLRNNTMPGPPTINTVALTNVIFINNPFKHSQNPLKHMSRNSKQPNNKLPMHSSTRDFER